MKEPTLKVDEIHRAEMDPNISVGVTFVHASDYVRRHTMTWEF